MPTTCRSFERRQFISTLFGAGVATAALGQGPKLSYKGENIQYGLVTYMWGADLDLPTLIDTCDSAGVQGVELRVEHAHKVDPTLTPPQRAEVRKRFEDARVKLIGMGTNFEFHDADPAKVLKNIAGAKEYIKLSHDIGGSGVKVKPNALPKTVAKEKTLDQIAKSLAELADYAVGFGQEIRLEVHGGVTDLGVQRFIEIWSAMPELYLLIIFSAVFDPSIGLLLILLGLFGWMGLSDYVRAEFLRNRQLDYVRSARALGLSNSQIIWRHVLPNSLTPVVTFLPFRMSAAILALTSLDFLGLGVLPGTPSLGELLAQGKNNMDAWWISISTFAVLVITLMLLTFMGDALRDALDPRKADQ